MEHKEEVYELRPDQLEAVTGGRYYPGSYKTEAISFLKEHMDRKTYDLVMSSGEGHRHPYVAAKVFLSGADWEKYVWIEQYGSLDGFPG